MLDWPSRIRDLLAGEGPMMVFQTIHRLTDLSVVGVEALARFPEDRLPAGSHESGLTDEAGLGFGPDVWFQAADLHGLGTELEVSAVVAALSQLHRLPWPWYMAVNIGPTALVSRQLNGALNGNDLSRVVIELTEHLAISDYGAVKLAVLELQQAHSVGTCTKIPAFAADDMGAGIASLRHLAELGDLLSFVKLDLSLTVGINVDRSRQALARAIVRMGLDLDFRVVAEGVETQSQLDALRDLDVHAGQGWLFSRPGQLPSVVAPATLGGSNGYPLPHHPPSR